MSRMPTSAELDQAVQLLEAGELVAFPTETVYGLGADAENPEAIARIYAAKGRPSNHPIIVHVVDGGDISYWVDDVPPAAQDLIDAFWPGAYPGGGCRWPGQHWPALPVASGCAGAAGPLQAWPWRHCRAVREQVWAG